MCDLCLILNSGCHGLEMEQHSPDKCLYPQDTSQTNHSLAHPTFFPLPTPGMELKTGDIKREKFLCNADLSPAPCARWCSWLGEHLALLGDHQVAQIGPLHGGGVSSWLALAPFALKRKGEAAEKKCAHSLKKCCLEPSKRIVVGQAKEKGSP